MKCKGCNGLKNKGRKKPKGTAWQGRVRKGTENTRGEEAGRGGGGNTGPIFDLLKDTRH